MSLSDTFKQSGAPVRQARVHFSTAKDTNRIIRFYRANAHQHVDQRSDDMIREAATTGRFILISEKYNRLGASSATYDYKQGTSTAYWTEVGSTRAALEGFGLYAPIIASQVIYEFLTSPPNDHFFAAVYADNTAVASLLEKKVGWTPFTPGDALLDASGERENHDKGKILWLKADSQSLPHQARVVLDFIDKASTTGIENRKTGEWLKIDMTDFPLAHRLRPLVEALANSDFAKALENNPNQPMAQTRGLLQKYMSNALFIFRPKTLS